MNHLYLFFIASLMLNLTPGNDMLYVISRTLSQGIKGGLYSSLGIFLGGLVHISAAILGLSILIAKSAFLFGIIKFAGAFYLVYIGIKSLLSKPGLDIENQQAEQVNHLKLLKQGMTTNVLNPKVAIFFLSFLPQFVDVNSKNIELQLLTLGLWFDIQGTLVLILVALIVNRTTNFVRKKPAFWKIQERITGFILIALGIKLALSTKK
ncbi:MAG: LysE family translocator [Sphingobacteriaceae bacterium]|nr:LysE family translocator [Sphingobacteriaceae bacterium]